MKTKKQLFFIIIILINLLYVNQNVNGFGYNLKSFNIDKDFYYSNDIINMSAVWELNYDPALMNCYIQFNIYDNHEVLIWNSTKYHQTGEGNWSIIIQNLNLSFSNNAASICVKYIINWIDFSSGISEETIIELIERDIFKRNVYCKLIDFKGKIFCGTNLDFKAQFLEVTTNSSLVITNQTINFEVFFEKEKIYYENLSTDLFGIIKVFISSDYLNIGEYYLIFLLKTNKVYSECFIEQTLIVVTEANTEGIDEQEIADQSSQLDIIVLFSTLFLLLGTLSVILYNKRKGKLIDTKKLTFKF